MTLGSFVRKNRPRWQRLETMLGTIEARGPRRTDRSFLRELSSLYRATTGDLAFAQTHYRGTTLLLFLHQLVARAHNQIYRPHRFSPQAAGSFIRNEIPQAARNHLQAVAWSAIIFLIGVALGLSAVQFDERAASIVLPSSVLNSIYSGRMWTGSIFTVVPAPVMSTVLFTNNISVALLAFAGGLSFGFITAWILFQNGFMLGVVFKLCADYGLLGALLEFIASHGMLEISSIIVSGGAGFVVANALLNPGAYSRADALAYHGPQAVRMAVSCVPALITAGCIEAFISPSHFPIWFKVTLGLTLGLSYWLYLLFTGRGTVKAAPTP
ncbi:MAG: stage II sporulation protein M [Methylacidiphilales bacterium]|nr:stage II sporulation protein M [Candidatus Methylacidiphilales bacterium]